MSNRIAGWLAPTRQTLDEVPLADVFPPRPGSSLMTMCVGQWDDILAGAYQDGWVLIEVDDNENAVRAYQRREPQ